jgi:hypothetical protein
MRTRRYGVNIAWRCAGRGVGRLTSTHRTCRRYRLAVVIYIDVCFQ